MDRLDVRLVALLGVALLPIGIIAMVQTYRVIDNANDVARQALIGETTRAVNHERETLAQLRGAARATARFLPSYIDNPQACSEMMQGVVEAFSVPAFVGYINAAGIVSCASQEAGRDVSENPIFARFQTRPRPFFAAAESVVSGRPVIIVVEPVFRDGQVNGYVAVSVQQTPLSLDAEPSGQLDPVGNLTIASDGSVLIASASDPDQFMRNYAPEGSDIVELLGEGSYNVDGIARNGTPVIYSIVPLVPNEVWAVSIWRAASVATGGLTAASAILFPFLMWLVSIGVAYFAVHRLVVRHIRDLRQRIRAFSSNRRMLSASGMRDLPSELRDVVEAFEHLTERIVRDEADLENSLHEKNVLLKEVHHRVKNNLQLISSMLNMQMRKTRDGEVRELLHRMQDRILGLATIHRNLYRADVLSRVETDRLIADLVAQIVDPTVVAKMELDLSVDVEPVALYPDQAVPLSLLMTETLTNALNYVGRPPVGNPWIRIELSDSHGMVTMCCSNSAGPPVTRPLNRAEQGLGRQLMQAFALQLDGTLDSGECDDSYRVRIRFRTSDFAQEL